MKILLTNNQLNYYDGSETFTYTLAEELFRLGHQIDILTFEKGLMSKAISKFGTLTDKPSEYDLIFVNHNTCLERVKNIKGYKIMTCHGIFPKQEQPIPGADSYVAVSEEVQEHLKSKGFESTIIRNGINLDRFNFNGTNNKKKKILSLSKGIKAIKWLESISVELDFDFRFLKNVHNIEDYIKEADVVVSYGRGALEGLACGKSVVVYDIRSYTMPFADDIITADNIMELAINNFSGRRFKNEWTREELKLKIKEAVDNKCDCRKFIEEYFDIKKNVKEYLKLYNEN